MHSDHVCIYLQCFDAHQLLTMYCINSTEPKVVCKASVRCCSYWRREEIRGNVDSPLPSPLMQSSVLSIRGSLHFISSSRLRRFISLPLPVGAIPSIHIVDRAPTPSLLSLLPQERVRRIPSHWEDTCVGTKVDCSRRCTYRISICVAFH